MNIVFYSAPQSSASPVVSALHELGLAHQRVDFDLRQEAHKQPGYLTINPNGKVPALTVNGTPMFEALAILLWLGETFGPERGLWPQHGDPERLQALAWCTWAYVTYGSMLARLHYSSSPTVAEELHHAPQAQYATEALDQLLALLDQRLSRQPYMLGSHYSLVDLVVASVVGYSQWLGAPVPNHPHVEAWLRDFQSREAYRTTLAPQAA